MPFADADIRVDLACGKCPDKHWSGSYISVSGQTRFTTWGSAQTSRPR
jgi:hypothetical protein